MYEWTAFDAIDGRPSDGHHAHVVICALDHHAPGELLRRIRAEFAESSVILVGADLSQAITAIRSGADEFLNVQSVNGEVQLAIEKCLVHQRIKRENEALHTELRQSLSELAETNQELQTVVQQLETMARTDELTGLSNRRWFNLMLEGHWAEATRHNFPLACLMIDLDGFKTVNDQLGHHCGDDFLRLAARVLRANCREIDVPARYGGDEFCVLMAHTQSHDALMVAQRVLREFHEAMRRRPANEPRVTMSIGVSHINLSRPANAVQLVNHADEAMYAAKNAGKQRVMIRDHDGSRSTINDASNDQLIEHRTEGIPVCG